MTPLSWVYMLLVWAAIIALNVFCFWNIFRKREDKVRRQDEDDHPAG